MNARPDIRGLLIVAAAGAGLLLAAFVLRRGSREDVAPAPADPRKQQLADFWGAFRQGNRFRQQGRYDEAAAAYAKCLELNPAHEESLYYLGISMEQIGQYAAAAQAYQRLLELNPAAGRALTQLGALLADDNPAWMPDYTRARSLFEKAVELNREQAGPFLHLGLVDLNLGRFSDALEDFRIAGRAGSPEGDFWAGYTYLLQGDGAAAARHFTRAVAVRERERRLSGAGVRAEGDRRPAPGRPLSAVERAAVKAMACLTWLEPAPKGRPSAPMFESVSEAAGVRPGGRGAWGDLHADGRPDLALTTAGALVLYRNLGGRFSDVTASAGLARIEDVRDVVWGDFDRNGRPDLYLLCGRAAPASNRLFLNQGDGTFAEFTAGSGLDSVRSTARALLADFDGDRMQELLEVGTDGARRGFLKLYRAADRRWVEITARAGLVAQGTPVDAAVADFNRDGAPDLFILYWRRPPALYLNDGRGRFTASTGSAGLGDLRADTSSVVAADFDGDRLPDLFVAIHAPFEEVLRCLLQPDYRPGKYHPRLFRNLGAGRFADISQQSGFTQASGTLQALAADFDRDGRPDLLLANGSRDLKRLEPAVILKNNGAMSFREWARIPERGIPGNNVGAAVADFDGDGAPDIYLAANPRLPAKLQRAGLLRNRTRRPNP